MATTRKTAAKKAAPKVESAEEAFDAAEATFANATQQFGSMFTVFTDQAETFRAQSEEVMQAVRLQMETAQEQMAEANRELAEAARTDFAEAVDFANELGRAKTVADAVEIQRDYWTRFFETRVERTKAMTETSTAAMQGVMEPFQRAMTAFQPAGFEKFFTPFAK